jgi:hypothetical protein
MYIDMHMHTLYICKYDKISVLLFPGGIVCIVTRMENFRNLEEYKYSFFPLCDKLENDGKWKKIDCSSCPFWESVEGVQVVYKKL